MTQDRGVALKLLYAIKSKTDAMRGVLQDSKRVGALSEYFFAAASVHLLVLTRPPQWSPQARR